MECKSSLIAWDLQGCNKGSVSSSYNVFKVHTEKVKIIKHSTWQALVQLSVSFLIWGLFMFRDASVIFRKTSDIFFTRLPYLWCHLLVAFVDTLGSSSGFFPHSFDDMKSELMWRWHVSSYPFKKDGHLLRDAYDCTVCWGWKRQPRKLFWTRRMKCPFHSWRKQKVSRNRGWSSRLQSCLQLPILEIPSVQPFMLNEG